MMLETIYRTACNGNHDALTWLNTFHELAHLADDLVDEVFSAEGLGRLLVTNIALCSLPFWFAWHAELRPILNQTCSNWLDSVELERRPQAWAREYANTLRLCGNDLVIAVARICGGWEHSRKIALSVRELAWRNQCENQTVEIEPCQEPT